MVVVERAAVERMAPPHLAFTRSWAAQSGTWSSLRRSSRCYAELPLNVRGVNLRKPPGHNTRNTRCVGMCQMQHP